MNGTVSGFNGIRLDPVSGTTHLGNGQRACNPVLMRFNCPDSWSPFGRGGINAYAYCTGDPVNQTDPSGHFSLGQGIGMSIGLLAGVALSVVTEGTAMPAVLSLMATVVGNAAIGAGSELITDAVDDQRINWDQVGIAAGISAAATVAGYGLGMASKLKGASDRPFGGLMMVRGVKAEQVNTVLGFQGGADIAKGLSKAERMQAIEHTLKYDIRGNSVHFFKEERAGNTVYKSEFKFRYERDVWTTTETYRTKSLDRFYTSDVKEYGFGLYQETLNENESYMPKRLVTEGVMERTTLLKTQRLTGERLLNTYLNDTPTGCSEKHLMNSLGLTARKLIIDGVANSDYVMELNEDLRQYFA